MRAPEHRTPSPQSPRDPSRRGAQGRGAAARWRPRGLLLLAGTTASLLGAGGPAAPPRVRAFDPATVQDADDGSAGFPPGGRVGARHDD